MPVQYVTIKIYDKILQNLARRLDVSRTSLSSESEIMKSSLYNEEMPMGTLTYSMRASLECLKNVTQNRIVPFMKYCT